MNNPIPGVTYVRTATGLHALGRPSMDTVVIPPVKATSRTLPPVSNLWTPADSRYAGLLPGWTPADLDPVYPNTSGYISATQPYYENKLFWGQFRPGTTGPELHNCAVAGYPPSVYTQLSGLIRSFPTDTAQFWIHDSLLDASLWMDDTLNASRAGITTTAWRAAVPHAVWAPKLAMSTGVHGGRLTMSRCEIRYVQDGINSVQTGSGLSDPGFTLIEDSWIHDMHYYNEYGYTPNNGTHSDGFQFNTGHDITLRHNYIGGRPRDESGFYPNGVPTPGLIGFNAGHDFFNAGIEWEQEAGMTDAYLIFDVTIEGNIFENGERGINHYYNPARPNLFDNSFVRDNFFVRRATSNKYINRHINFASMYTNNRVIDLNPDGSFSVGELVVPTNG